MSSSRYLEDLYDTTFESVHEVLREQARRNPARAVYQIRQVLKTLYVQQGNNWAGRGVVGDTSIDASIAAHESILADLDYLEGVAMRNALEQLFYFGVGSALWAKEKLDHDIAALRAELSRDRPEEPGNGGAVS